MIGDGSGRVHSEIKSLALTVYPKENRHDHALKRIVVAALLKQQPVW
jgi:hypothetical protein